jgi:hypothetical protein
MNTFPSRVVSLREADCRPPRRPRSPQDTCHASPDQLLWALVNIFAQIAGMATPLSCEAVQALAANYMCLERQQQLPALIALAAQIAANGTNPPGFGQQIFEGAYGSYPTPPNFTPTVPAAIAFSTNDGSVWNWYSGSWH